MSEEYARFEELQARAKGLGWELLHRNDPETGPWGYVLSPLDQDPATVNVCTTSAARLDPEDPDDPLTGLDTVSHMLDQIEEIQRRQNARK
jgi:hypothetical protein